MDNHTSKHWKVEKWEWDIAGKNELHLVVVDCNDTLMIAEINMDKHQLNDEYLYNANLISTAPDLLAVW